MARTLLPAPTLFLGPGPGAGLALPAAEATSITGFTGVNFANNGGILLRYVVAAGNNGNISIIFTRATDGSLPAPLVIAVAASTTYILGPWGPSNYNDGSGLIQIDKSGTVTGDTAGLYFQNSARV
jgi:hypothetical protein